MDISKETIDSALASIMLPSKQMLLESNLIESAELQGAKLTLIFSNHNYSINEIAPIKSAIMQALKEAGVQEINIVDAKSEQPKINKPKSKLYFANYKRVVLIASGKGGVGKSTCTLNLSLALQHLGKSVAIFDADVYGPSQPLLFGMRGYKPEVKDNKLKPLHKFGLDYISIGNFIEEGEAVAWRGPLVHQALEQIMRDIDFPGGDYMIIDMPPGTGDVQITLAQQTSAFGAVIVCTPQDIALIDARRAMAMFAKVNIPVIGMIENMSSLTCPHCNEPIDFYPSGAVKKEAENFKLNYLGAIDIDPRIIMASDTGKPLLVTDKESKTAKQYLAIANNLINLPDAEI